MFGNIRVLSVLPVWPLFVIWTCLESRKRPSGLYFCSWRRCRASACCQGGQGVSAWQPLGNGDVQQGAELAAVENLGGREGRRERRQRSYLYGGGLSSSGKAHSPQPPGAASGVTGQLALQSSADLLPKRQVGFRHLCGFSLASFCCLFCWWPSVLLLGSVQWHSSMES